MSLLFTPTNDPVQCFTVSIFDDLVSEGEETFTLSVSTTSDRAFAGQEATKVRIVDNDETQTLPSKI